jgi:hypothetical protein
MSRRDNEDAWRRLMDRVDTTLHENSAAIEISEILAQKTRILESYGNDDFEESAVIRFAKSFTPDGMPYEYAAIKAGGQWFTTSTKSVRGYTWSELCHWLVSGVPVTRITLLDARPRVVAYYDAKVKEPDEIPNQGGEQ